MASKAKEDKEDGKQDAEESNARKIVTTKQVDATYCFGALLVPALFVLRTISTSYIGIGHCCGCSFEYLFFFCD
jgi:hypothetical protein